MAELNEKDEQAVGRVVIRFFPAILDLAKKWALPMTLGLALGGGGSTGFHSLSRDPRVDTLMKNSSITLQELGWQKQSRDSLAMALNAHEVSDSAKMAAILGARHKRSYPVAHESSGLSNK